MFNQLSDRLEGVFKTLRGQGKISEKNVSDAMREVRLALLEADVDFKVAKAFIANVREKALGTEVLKSITPGQQIVKIFHDELAELLGGDAAGLDLNPPGRILMVGLNGAGKTTTSAKLALHLAAAFALGMLLHAIAPGILASIAACWAVLHGAALVVQAVTQAVITSAKPRSLPPMDITTSSTS